MSFRLQGKRAPISTLAFAGSAAGHTPAHPGAWPSPAWRQRPPSAGVTGRGETWARTWPGSGAAGCPGRQGPRGQRPALSTRPRRGGCGLQSHRESGRGAGRGTPRLPGRRPTSGAPRGLAETHGGPRTSSLGPGLGVPLSCRSFPCAPHSAVTPAPLPAPDPHTAGRDPGQVTQPPQEEA